MRLLAVFCFVLLFSSCDDESSLVPRGGNDITRERAAWITLDYDTYELTQQRQCFCFHGGEPVRLFVRNDSLISGMLLIDSSMLSAQELEGYLTVDGLFDFVADVDVAAVAEFRLVFDSVYHFPSDFWVDRSRNIADEEIGYRSYDFLPLP